MGTPSEEVSIGCRASARWRRTFAAAAIPIGRERHLHGPGLHQPRVLRPHSWAPRRRRCLLDAGLPRDGVGHSPPLRFRSGVNGIYMDQACTSLACYDPTHGHPVGGGVYWMQGFRAMASDIRRRCDSRHEPVVLAGEGCGEPWLPYLDLMLSLQVSRERYMTPDAWDTIPFFPAVYHPYAVAYRSEE